MLNLLSREQWNNILGKQWNLFFIGTGSINSIKSGGLWIIWYRIFRVDTENRYSYSLFHPIKK